MSDDDVTVGETRSAAELVRRVIETSPRELDAFGAIVICDQCGGPAHLCELPDSTCRLKNIAREYIDAAAIVKAGEQTDADAARRRLARLLRTVEDAAWERLSVARTKALESLADRQSELIEALVTVYDFECAHPYSSGNVCPCCQKLFHVAKKALGR